MICTTGCSLSAYQPVEQSLAYLAKASRCPLLLKQTLGFHIIHRERRKRFQVLKSLGACTMCHLLLRTGHGKLFAAPDAQRPHGQRCGPSCLHPANGRDHRRSFRHACVKQRALPRPKAGPPGADAAGISDSEGAAACILHTEEWSWLLLQCRRGCGGALMH